MKTNRVVKVRLQHPDSHQTDARMEAARCWNDMVKLHKYIRKRHWKWPSKNDLQKHFKGKYQLHSQTVQALVDKFIANIETTQTSRKNGDKNARYPWRCKKKFQVAIWKGQSIRLKGNRIALPMGRGRKPVRIKLAFDKLPAGKIVAAELGFRELRLTIQNCVEPVESAGDNTVAADLGIIHTAVMTDGLKSQAIVGRGLRSLTQGKNKQHAEYTALIDRCKDSSRRKRKLKRSRARMLARYHRRVHNLLHHAANQMIDFALERKAGTLVIGDAINIAKNKRKTKKGSRRLNQENSGNPLGRLVSYLSYKGKLKGVDIIKINEAYTSQTCPKCGHRHKPSGRVYKCRNKECSFTAPRDEVGAVNILCKYLHGEMNPDLILPSGSVKYLRPVKLRQSVVVPLTWDKLPDTTRSLVPAALVVDTQLSLELGAVA